MAPFAESVASCCLQQGRRWSDRLVGNTSKSHACQPVVVSHAVNAYVNAGVCMQTIATLAADPVASLVDTAFIGHLGEL